jgi:hypothetical protein
MNGFLHYLFTAGVAAAVAAIVVALINNWGAFRSINFQYRLEERRKLRDLMGEYTGRLLEAAVDWDRRMNQMYNRAYLWKQLFPGDEERISGHHPSPPLAHEHRRAPEEYGYHSLVFRFLRLLAIARRFEAEAFYINAKLADEEGRATRRSPLTSRLLRRPSGAWPLEFLCYAKSFIWVMTYSELTPDDHMPALDHFLNDEFRPLLDLCYRDYGGSDSSSKAPAGEPIFDWRRFLTLLRNDLDDESRREIDKALEYFDGLSPVEYTFGTERYPEPVPEGQKRRRWERLVCLHLLALNFIETFGYSWQRDVEDRRKLALHFLSRDEHVTKTFRNGLDTLGLSHQKQMISLRADLAGLKENNPFYGALIECRDKGYVCTNKRKDDSPCQDWYVKHDDYLSSPSMPSAMKKDQCTDGLHCLLPQVGPCPGPVRWRNPARRYAMCMRSAETLPLVTVRSASRAARAAFRRVKVGSIGHSRRPRYLWHHA